MTEKKWKYTYKGGMRIDEWGLRIKGMRIEECGMRIQKWVMKIEEWWWRNENWGIGNEKRGFRNEEWGIRNDDWGLKIKKWGMRNEEKELKWKKLKFNRYFFLFFNLHLSVFISVLWWTKTVDILILFLFAKYANIANVRTGLHL